MPKKNRLIEEQKIRPPKRQVPASLETVVASADQTTSPQEQFPNIGISNLKGKMNSLHATDEQRHLLEAILQATSDGILAVNRENEVLFASQRFAEMWRIPPEIMVSKDDTILLQYVLDQLTDPQDFLQKVQELYHSSEESFDTLYFKDGRVFERLSRPILEEKELRGRVWSFRDVTKSKQAENALSASEAELRALFASMQDVVLVIDREGVYRKIAPTNPSLLVKPPEELLGKNLKDVFPVKWAETSRQIIQKVLDTKQNTQIEYELVINSRSMWFQATISPLDADSTLWVAHDISNRKQMEEDLRTAEAKYHSIFENATEGIYQSSPQGRFLRVNPVMAHIFGYDSPEDMLNSINSIEKQYYVDSADRHEFQRLMIEQGEAHNFISLNYRKNGEQIWIQESARAVKDVQGNILYYEGFAADITARKQAEEELRQAKVDLETALLELQKSLEREKLLASTDGLTGLWNRRHFFEIAPREFEAAVRYGYSLTFLMFDLDHFKQINDSLGHTVGDKLLVKIAQAAAAQVRASDIVARYGGDEFVVMLPHASAQQALPVAERIRRSAAEIGLDASFVGKEPFTLTLSIGIAEMRREATDDNVERVIQYADEALYKAKASGRNRTVIFGQDETRVT